MTERRDMRASDADRVQVAEQLRRAILEGRLLAHEFDERLGHTLDARTYGELDAIVADLPHETGLTERPGHGGAQPERRPRTTAAALRRAGAMLHHRSPPLGRVAGTAGRVCAVIRRRPTAVVSSAAATAAAAATAVVLLTSSTSVPLAAQQVPVHDPGLATCDHNGGEVACKICNPDGFVVQHGAISVAIGDRCTARDRRPMPGEVRTTRR